MTNTKDAANMDGAARHSSQKVPQQTPLVFASGLLHNKTPCNQFRAHAQTKKPPKTASPLGEIQTTV
jgi:hypothetical protein